MSLPFEFDGPPSRWVPRGGRPADCVWSYKPAPGLPSYESATGALVVFDNLNAGGLGAKFTVGHGLGLARGDDLVFLPRSYGGAAVRDVLVGGDGLCALHDDPAAVWSWRPLLYLYQGARGLRRFGSQEELEWRYGLVYGIMDRQDNVEVVDIGDGQVEVVIHGGRDRRQAANERARELLLEHLDWRQRLDFLAWGHFHERGEANQLYKIRPGNGFAIVDPVTREELISFCLHPETWIPHDDVALATLLLIRQGTAGEAELLGGARPSLVGGRTRTRATRDERKAHELERALA